MSVNGKNVIHITSADMVDPKDIVRAEVDSVALSLALSLVEHRVQTNNIKATVYNGSATQIVVKFPCTCERKKFDNLAFGTDDFIHITDSIRKLKFIVPMIILVCHIPIGCVKCTLLAEEGSARSKMWLCTGNGKVLLFSEKAAADEQAADEPGAIVSEIEVTPKRKRTE